MKRRACVSFNCESTMMSIDVRNQSGGPRSFSWSRASRVEPPVFQTDAPILDSRMES